MNIYLDNASTTKTRKEIKDEIPYFLEEKYGNPSSLHRMGLQSEKDINKTREIIANLLNVKSKEIYFTSGGTESNNIAIQGVLEKYKKEKVHIITSKIEHSSVLNVFKEYEKNDNIEVSYLDVNKFGLIEIGEVKKNIKDNTVLVSIMSVNNEIGSIQNILDIGKMIKSIDKNIIFHSDGVQAFCKLDMDLNKSYVDIFSFSGHKIHALKGIGGIYIRESIKLKSIFLGGNQENGLRAGTENSLGIYSLGKAVEISEKRKGVERKNIRYIKKYFLSEIEKKIPLIKINSPFTKDYSDNILNISFLYTKGEIILHSLEEKNIYLSTTSACNSKGMKKSQVLEGIDLSDIEAQGAIRISFSYENTIEEIDYVVENLKNIVNDIRMITMRRS